MTLEDDVRGYPLFHCLPFCVLKILIVAQAYNDCGSLCRFFNRNLSVKTNHGH